MKKIISIIMVIVVCITSILSFSGCGKNTIEADASQYLTKGEWFAYFSAETNLQCSSSTVDLDIDENSEYYEVVKFIVANEIIDSKTACSNLDKIVTKDIVAYTCVNYLPPAFRTESSLVFKDAKKITDVGAAAEAVDYGIVEGKSSTKFGPDELMNVDDCEKAVNATVKRLTTYEFSEEESNFDIKYRDNVYDTNAEVEVVEGSISDYTDYTEEIGTAKTDGMAYDGNELSVSMLGLKTTTPQVTNVAKKEDVVTIRISETEYLKNKKAYKKGNIVKLQPFQLRAEFKNSIKTVECCYLKITLDPLKVGSSYSITGILPTVQDAIESVGKDQRATSQASNGKVTENSKADGVSGFTVTSDGAKFTYTSKVGGTVDLKNGRSNKTDPTLEAEFNLIVSISDIKLTTTGFDTILLDAVFGEPNATIGISYNTSVVVNAKFPKTRFAPYNNGNGKFPSNLSRSRLTTGKGAADIKIGKLKYAFGPIVAEFGLYLQIYLDGSINVTLKKDSSTTYVINKEGLRKPVCSSDKELKAKAEVNLYAGVELRGDVHILGFSSLPICDMKAGMGFNLQGAGSFFILTSENKYTDKTDTNLSGEELKNTINQYKDTKFGYCLNVKFDFVIYGEIASGKCIIGKVAKLIDHNYSSISASKTFPLLEVHWEDGHKVANCTRESADGKKETKTFNGIVASDGIDISEYNMVLPNNSCGFFKVTKVPGKAKNIEKTAKSLIVSSSNPRVCTATYFKGDNIVSVDAHSPGQAEVWVMTSTRKYRMVCAVIVNENMQVSFVPNENTNDFILAI